MKAPMSWLREAAGLGADVAASDLAAKFTAAGLTVEHIVRTGAEVTGPLVVGRVLSKTDEEQKNGKTVHYCRVDVGDEHNDQPMDDYPASRGIICGAHNFSAGDLVVVALPGAVLPGDFQIAARKTYGHISDGMICSQLELGLGEDHDGIIVLDAALGLNPGDDAIAALWTSDEVLEIDLTPDLSYALSIRGLARDAAQLFGASYTDRYARPVPQAVVDGYPVELADEACPLFVALRLDGFNPAAASPSWLVRRLEAAGMRSISLAVDVTNYVMLESGQPLHAYDADTLAGPIVVRLAREGETLVTLDDVTRELVRSDLLIADDSGPIGLAGVMGGASTEISAATTSIVLEAAHFDPVTVSKTMRRLNLPSEASKRFERGVDPALPYAAAHRAMELMVEYGGGRRSADETVAGGVASPPSIAMRATLPAQVLGADISTSEVISTLQKSGVQVTAMGDSLTLTPPTWRNDLRDPFDYVEEVGSKVGFHRIGSSVPSAPIGRGYTERQQGRRRVLQAVADLGFVEVLSLPFSSLDDLDKLGLAADDPRRNVVRLANPLSDTHPFLRTSLLPGLFAAVAKNTSRSMGDLALFEQGLGFFDFDTPDAPRPSVAHRPSADELAALDAALPTQADTIAAVVTGNWMMPGWSGPATPATWEHVVAFAETAAAALGVRLKRRNAEAAPWHPGRCAELSVDGQVLGFAGELHPAVCAAFGLPARACAVEFNLGDLLAAAPHSGQVKALSPFPLAKEDVALIVGADVAAADVEASLVQGAGPLLESVSLFDIYTGPQIGEGKKSLAFALRFRGDATLTDEEAAQARQNAVAVAVERFGAVQRA